MSSVAGFFSDQSRKRSSAQAATSSAPAPNLPPADPNKRYIAHQLDDTAPPAPLKKLADRFLATSLKLRDKIDAEYLRNLDASDNGSIYTGCGGIAYLNFRIFLKPKLSAPLEAGYVMLKPFSPIDLL